LGVDDADVEVVDECDDGSVFVGAADMKPLSRVPLALSHPRASVRSMESRKVWTAAEMELMTPDERARLVRDGMLDSLDDLDPEFRARVEAKGRRLAEHYGLLDSEAS